jgi:nitrogen fixation-related uncharacterized protein
MKTLAIGIVLGAAIGYLTFGWPVTSGQLIIPGKA